MTPFEVRSALDGMEILLDTREQDTPFLRARLAQTGCQVCREKLNFGDYSARFPLPDGTWLDLRKVAVVERKMDLGELALCFGTERKRFSREFERASAAGAKIYLLIENASFETIYAHKYRSKMHPNALVGSLFAWLARYNCSLIFCDKKHTGTLIREILYREGKELLERRVNETCMIPADTSS